MKEYSEYLRSTHWRTTRAKFLLNRKRKCEACGVENMNVPLHVHHQTYENIGREELSDLSLLCEDCHVEVHALADLMHDQMTLREATQHVIKEHREKPRVEYDPDPNPTRHSGKYRQRKHPLGFATVDWQRK